MYGVGPGNATALLNLYVLQIFTHDRILTRWSTRYNRILDDGKSIFLPSEKKKKKA